MDFKEALKQRRSYYQLSNTSPINDQEIEDLMNFAIKKVPSAFNSQSTRLVLCLGDQHLKFWDIVKDCLKKIVPEENFGATESKINNAFRAAYGTVLFYEDQNVVEGLQKQFPTYKDNFPIWSHHTNAMHQLAIWTMLKERELGASLQHYNPVIDEEVNKYFKINSHWKLIAQMPFGTPISEPQPKELVEVGDRIKIFK